MREYAANIRASELSLVDAPNAPNAPAWSTDAAAPAVAPARAVAERVAPPPSEDRFLAKARSEHAAGHVDASLWARAAAQAGDDKAQATRIYVDLRATALRVEKRNERATRRALVVEKLSSAPETGFGAELAEAPKARDEATPEKSARKNLGGSANPKRWRLIAVAGTVGCLLIVAGVIALRWESSPAQPDKVAKPAAVAEASKSSMSPVRTAAAATRPDATALANTSTEDIVSQVQALEKAGNWHLLAIYAAEWTRKQPGNPSAWKQLSQAYVRLRQFNEAVDAATKAIQLAPEDSLLWQNLGQINLAVPRFAEALAAFQQAAVLNDEDVASLTQIGVLNTQLGNLPDARIAFYKALAVSPEDVPALCGAASLAQKEGRAKDAETMTGKVAALYSVCPEPPARESTRVAASDPAPSKSKSAPVRR